MSDPSDNSDPEMGEAAATEENAAETTSEEATSGEDFSARGDKQPLVDRRKKAVLGVPIEVVISVGKARSLLSELVGLRRDSVLTLDSKIEDPVEIMVGDRVIARGELQEVDSDTGRLCVRLTEVADLSQSL